MPELASLGIDAWQPLERKAQNDLARVKATYGHMITPMGNVDSSTILPYHRVENVNNRFCRENQRLQQTTRYNFDRLSIKN